MGNQTTVQRTFVIKAGMTPQDVITSKEATAQQKKIAYVFDADGITGYSQREADVFNATIIADRGKNGVSLWTRYKDGSRKEVKCTGDISNFKYAPKGEVKPYIVRNSLATKMIQNFQQTGNGELKIETYSTGNVKRKTLNNSSTKVDINYYDNGNIQHEVVKKSEKSGLFGLFRYNYTANENHYYENGKLKSSYEQKPPIPDYKSLRIVKKSFNENGKINNRQVEVSDGWEIYVSEEDKYYPNGKLKSQFKRMDSHNGKCSVVNYTEDGKKLNEQIKRPRDYKWEDPEIILLDKQYYPNGKLKYSFKRDNSAWKQTTVENYYANGQKQNKIVKKEMQVRNQSFSNDNNEMVEIEHNEYYSNGKLKSAYLKEPSPLGKETTATYYENGKLKSRIIKEYKDFRWVETTHIEYDSNGNIIGNAKITK